MWRSEPPVRTESRVRRLTNRYSRNLRAGLSSAGLGHSDRGGFVGPNGTHTMNTCTTNLRSALVSDDINTECCKNGRLHAFVQGYLMPCSLNYQLSHLCCTACWLISLALLSWCFSRSLPVYEVIN